MTLKNSIVVIPARKNSKRIKGKNLRILNGKPLISHSIEYALKYIDKKNIWVNTDDQLVIDLAKKYNISYYKRPALLAQDETSTNDVIIDFCQYLVEKGVKFKNIITLQPTNPIRSENLLNTAMKEFLKSERKSLISVSTLDKKFGRVINDNYLPMNYKLGERHQDLETLYYENGLIYISNIDAILKEKAYISNNSYPLITNEIGALIDIDYEKDLQLAEIVITMKKQD